MSFISLVCFILQKYIFPKHETWILLNFSFEKQKSPVTVSNTANFFVFLRV